MSADALFQLGIVSVALNTSQTEEYFRRYTRHSVVHTRAARLNLTVSPAHGAAQSRAAVRMPAWQRRGQQALPNSQNYRERMPI